MHRESARASAKDQILWLLDEGFEGSEWHSLLSNLRNVTPDEWRWVPERGHRSIHDIVQHVGSCTFMYENYAFGDGSFGWDDPLVDGYGVLEDVASAIIWLREGHERLRRSVAGLTDADLARPRPTNWGEPKETRWIIAVMIQHDLYHAGEINHIRALYGRHDRWEHEAEA